MKEEIQIDNAIWTSDYELPDFLSIDDIETLFRAIITAHQDFIKEGTTINIRIVANEGDTDGIEVPFTWVETLKM